MPDPGRSPAAKQATVILLDMSAVIHFLKPQRATVFGEYTNMHLLPYLESQITQKTTRVDAVWDTYKDDSLKSQTRTKRGETGGRRTRVSAKIPIPKGTEWQKFLTESHNKDELYQFLSEELEKNTTGASYHLFTTKADLVLSNRPADLTGLSPCLQEEADTRIMLHLNHAAKQGHTNAYIRTVDTDVVVIAISFFIQMNLSELWIGFGTGKTFREIPIHYISQQLGPKRCLALPFFHAFTGCDVTSAMLGVGKKLHGMHGLVFPIIPMPQTPSSLSPMNHAVLHLTHYTCKAWSALLCSCIQQNLQCNISE